MRNETGGNSETGKESASAERKSLILYVQFTKWMWNPPFPHMQCTQQAPRGGTFGYSVGKWNWFKTSGGKKNDRECLNSEKPTVTPQSSNTVLREFQQVGVDGSDILVSNVCKVRPFFRPFQPCINAQCLDTHFK